MRALAFIPLLVLAGCGEAAPENKAAPAAAASIAAGQWELTSEVTSFDTADDGAPKINTPAGTRTVENVCVGAEGRPPTALFSGSGYDCEYGTYYVRNGRANVTLDCRRPGLQGSVQLAVDGTVEAEEFEFTRDIRTNLVTDGDVTIAARVTGRRTGDCAAEGGEDGKAG